MNAVNMQQPNDFQQRMFGLAAMPSQESQDYHDHEEPSPLLQLQHQESSIVVQQQHNQPSMTTSSSSLQPQDNFGSMILQSLSSVGGSNNNSTHKNTMKQHQTVSPRFQISQDSVIGMTGQQLLNSSSLGGITGHSFQPHDTFSAGGMVHMDSLHQSSSPQDHKRRKHFDEDSILPKPIKKFRPETGPISEDNNGAARLPIAFDAPPASKSPAPVSASNEPISFFEENDVLSGRGGGTNVHPGNRTFRDLINMHRRAYLKARKNDKPSISRAIVRTIRESGGRFLKKQEKQGCWIEIGDDAAREKTSQALRQRAPEMRRLLFDTEQREQQNHASASSSCHGIGGVPSVATEGHHHALLRQHHQRMLALTGSGTNNNTSACNMNNNNTFNMMNSNSNLMIGLQGGNNNATINHHGINDHSNHSHNTNNSSHGGSTNHQVYSNNGLINPSLVHQPVSGHNNKTGASSPSSTYQMNPGLSQMFEAALLQGGINRFTPNGA